MRSFLYWLASFFKHRITIIAVAFVVLFSVLAVHIFNLQIVMGDGYREALSVSIQKTVSTQAARGRIFDRNGVLLAYDENVYSVVISDSGKYTSRSEKHKAINDSIIKTLRIIKQNGDSYNNDFGITANGDGTYDYNISEAARPGFLRDAYGKATIGDLTEEEAGSSAGDVVSYMIKTYQIDSQGLTDEELIELLYLRMHLVANSYSRYKEITISSEVSEQTKAAIDESENSLAGIFVSSKYIRRYNDAKYYSALMGYTGIVSEEQLSALKEQNDSYEANDIVGKSGIEEAFETDLAGSKGEREVYLDTVGRITEVISEKESTAGNDVYLTIDAEMQKKIYDLLEDKLTDIVVSHLREGGEKYEYQNNTLSNVYILMYETYYAVLSNGLADFASLQRPTGDLEKQIYSKYQTRFNTISEWLRNELLSSQGTKYEALSDEQKEYVWRAYTILTDNKIINLNKVDTDNDVISWWNSGSGLSFKELIEKASEEGWIDISPISNEKYTDMNDVYKTISDYITTSIEKDNNFSLIIYKYLIKNGTITGREVCTLPYEQGRLNKDDGLYRQLSQGRLSASGYIRTALSQKIITPGTLGVSPSSGGAVIQDPRNGQVLALVSYPGYDLNRFSGSVDTAYYNALYSNDAKPLLNWATQGQTMPGSIFKICTAIASLDSGVTTPDTVVNCTGSFTEVTPSPRCWIYPGAHGNENVVTAIRDSCNIYFYTMGWRLARSKSGNYDSDYGTDILKEYAEKLGLATMSNIEIAETAPKASDTNAIATAIGQGTAQYSCLNISRYVSTVAMNGVCYDATLLLKITDHDGNLIYEKKQDPVSTMSDVSSSTWSAVKNGMIQAAQSYPSLRNRNFRVAGKTGTSQIDENHMDNGTFISYAPYDDPSIAVSIEIPNGYTSTNNVEIAGSFYEWYFNR